MIACNHFVGNRVSAEHGLARGRRDTAIVALAFRARLRRSEMAALVRGDVTPTARAGQLRVRVRASKANAAGRRGGLRLLAGPFARAVDQAAPRTSPRRLARPAPSQPPCPAHVPISGRMSMHNAVQQPRARGA